MRVAYLVITADREIRDEEKREFARLCALLDVEPGQDWTRISRLAPRPPQHRP